MDVSSEDVSCMGMKSADWKISGNIEIEFILFSTYSWIQRSDEEQSTTIFDNLFTLLISHDSACLKLMWLTRGRNFLTPIFDATFLHSLESKPNNNDIDRKIEHKQRFRFVTTLKEIDTYQCKLCRIFHLFIFLRKDMICRIVKADGAMKLYLWVIKRIICVITMKLWSLIHFNISQGELFSFLSFSFPSSLFHSRLRNPRDYIELFSLKGRKEN